MHNTQRIIRFWKIGVKGLKIYDTITVGVGDDKEGT